MTNFMRDQVYCEVCQYYVLYTDAMKHPDYEACVCRACVSDLRSAPPPPSTDGEPQP